jgi:lipoprotein-anchoring transpeptidase ErfK/SrfK
MKKNIFLVVLAVAMFLVPAITFAVETEVKDTAEKTAITTEASTNAATTETEPAAIATVSEVKDVESSVPSVKTETLQAEAVAPKTDSINLSEKKTTEVPAEASAPLNSAELQQRWKALFSKEAAPDSIIYKVKSGDSLYVLARKNHTTVDFIKKINGLKSNNIYVGMKLKIHTAPFSIKIDKAKNILTLYSNGEAVKKYSVATGKKNCTPVGEFKITDKLVNPTWFKTGAILPPGSPENALGTRWMGFDKPAYGIHGTIEPKSIGTQASEGCIRMLNEEVEELYSIIPTGTKVIIQD